MAFPSRAEYETLIYALLTEFPGVIRSSTLLIYSTSALIGKVEGQVQFATDLVLDVQEIIDFRRGRIIDYSYDISYHNEKIRWYDPQPHPELEILKPTFPHHRHEPPNIRQNRQPATGISFDTPNLDTLIQDCIELGTSLSAHQE